MGCFRYLSFIVVATKVSTGVGSASNVRRILVKSDTTLIQKRHTKQSTLGRRKTRKNAGNINKGFMPVMAINIDNNKKRKTLQLVQRSCNTMVMIHLNALFVQNCIRNSL